MEENDGVEEKNWVGRLKRRMKRISERIHSKQKKVVKSRKSS